MDRLRMKRGAEGIDGPQAIRREDSAAGTTSAPISAADASDHCSAAARRTRWGCRPEIVSRARSQAGAHPPAGSVSQEAGQGQGGDPGGAKSTDTSSGAFSVIHPGSRQLPQLASQGAPSDKTVNATASRRAPNGDFQDRLADMGGQYMRSAAACQERALRLKNFSISTAPKTTVDIASVRPSSPIVSG